MMVPFAFAVAAWLSASCVHASDAVGVLVHDVPLAVRFATPSVTTTMTCTVGDDRPWLVSSCWPVFTPPPMLVLPPTLIALIALVTAAKLLVSA
jgi:hypothetical protein